MEKIEIVFLGTGNAVPTKKRNHTSILLKYKNENILVDCGEGTQRQFKIAEISPSKISKILITHKHGDHILGIPGLLQTLAMSEYQKTLEIYGPRGTKRIVHLIEELVNPQIKMSVKEVSGKFIDHEEFTIECAPMAHGTPSNAYSFIIKDKRRLNKQKIKKLNLPNSPLLRKLAEGKDITLEGKKIKSSDVSYIEKGRKITFVLDTGLNEKAVKLAKNSDLLIIESTFSSEEEEQAKEYKHLTAKQAATIAKKAKVKSLILTHISQRYEYNTKKIKEEAEEIFPNVKIAKDLDKVII